MQQDKLCVVQFTGVLSTKTSVKASNWISL